MYVQFGVFNNTTLQHLPFKIITNYTIHMLGKYNKFFLPFFYHIYMTYQISVCFERTGGTLVHATFLISCINKPEKPDYIRGEEVRLADKH